MLKPRINNSEQEENDNELLNLVLIIKLVKRNKILISSLSIIFFIVGCLISLTIKRTWEGQFQIVLDSPKNNSSLLEKIGGVEGIGGNIKEQTISTNIEILQSPSVLMPVFDFFKNSIDNDSIEDINFSGWKKNLTIEKKRGTTVLDISYRDKEKSRIIPVLKEITFSYQKFSGRGKKRFQELKRNYLVDQIKLFKKKSSDSLREVQEFGINNSLAYQKFKPVSSTTDSKFDQNNNNIKDRVSRDSLTSQSGILPNVGIENVRVQSANRIRRIDLQLKKIKELEDVGELQYMGSSIPELVEEGLPQSLRKIDEKLLDLRSKYTDRDIKVISLLEKRKLTINFLKERTIKYLEAEKLEAEALMESATRPKGVLLKYKELLRTASRDEITLINLEDQLRVLKLEEATLEDPWELITKPTLLKSPVAPPRKRIGLLSLIFGFGLGIAASFYKEKTSGKIHEIEELRKNLPIPIISQINLSKINLETQKLIFIKEYIYKNLKGNLYFINFETIEFNDLEAFKKALIKENFDKEIIFSSDKQLLNKFKENDSKYLVLKIGSENYSDIEMLKKRINFLEINFDGIIVLHS